MRAAWLVRLGAVAVAGLMIIWPAGPAWAAEVEINPGNVPTTAAEFANHDCDPNFGGGPHSGEDVWVFVLPGNDGDFVSVTADFGQDGTKTIPTDGGSVVTDKGTSKAWIITPAGWTLVGASAEIIGKAKKFNLTHTCPTGGKPKPTDRPEPTDEPVPTDTPVPTEEPVSTVKPSGAPETGGGGGQSTGGVALGVGAVALAGLAGLGLTLTRRRRRGA